MFPGTKTATRHSDVPPERKPERGYVRQNHPFTKPPFYLPVIFIDRPEVVMRNSVSTEGATVRFHPEVVFSTNSIVGISFSNILGGFTNSQCRKILPRGPRREEEKRPPPPHLKPQEENNLFLLRADFVLTKDLNWLFEGTFAVK